MYGSTNDHAKRNDVLAALSRDCRRIAVLAATDTD